MPSLAAAYGRLPSIAVVLFDPRIEHAVVAASLQFGFVVIVYPLEVDLEFVGLGRLDFNLIAGVGSVRGEYHLVGGAPYGCPTSCQVEGLFLVG